MGMDVPLASMIQLPSLYEIRSVLDREYHLVRLVNESLDLGVIFQYGAGYLNLGTSSYSCSS